MSQGFSTFRWSNLNHRSAMINALKNTLSPNLGNVAFNIIIDGGQAAHADNRRISEDFIDRLTAIKECFNLDRSEAARRTFIDAFLIEALKQSSTRRAIVTQEHSVRDPTKFGNGEIDYVVGHLVIQPGAQDAEPHLIPSVIMEAKKGNQAMDAGQLIATMITAVQLGVAAGTALPEFIPGIMTDGRTWFFVQFGTAFSRGSLPIYISRNYLIVDNNDAISEGGCKAIVGILSGWFEKMGNPRATYFK